jgi:transcriptional regulator of acetoin/glycerol metabolism
VSSPALFLTARPGPAHSLSLPAAGSEEAAVIERVVAECGGNMSEAAKRLGVGRSTLYRKLRARG